MTDAALWSQSSEYLVSENNSLEISPRHSEDEEASMQQYRHKTTTTTTSTTLTSTTTINNVTALTLPEPRKAEFYVDVEKETLLSTSTLPATTLNHKINAGIMYKGYISDSSDLNSETSSLDGHHHPFRQSTGDLTLISKAVSIDTHASDTTGSSAIVPAERNPVSDLLRSPSSVTSTDGEESPIVTIAQSKGYNKRHSVPELAMSEYYASPEQVKRKTIKKKLMVSTSIASLSRQVMNRKRAETVGLGSQQQQQQQSQQSVVSSEEPPPPPSPTSYTSLKKNTVHYDHKIIPDHGVEDLYRLSQNFLINASEQKMPHGPPTPKFVESNNNSSSSNKVTSITATNTTVATVATNVIVESHPRFITMEEELQSTEDLLMSADEPSLESLTDMPNNLSMVDLTLTNESKEFKQHSEVRSLEQRRSIKRLNAIKELMETEETYSRDLGILCTHFLEIIKESSCITTDESDILVRNAMEILAFQEKFMETLIESHGDEQQEKNGIFYKGNLKNIALCFVEWAPKFDIYLDYCVRHDHAVSVYNELLQTNPEFADLIERLHTFHRVSYGFSRLKFDDYLIIPFQRIFRYRLLLQSITKATQKDSDEYEILSQAQNTIHSIATKINNEKSKMEAKRKTALFLSRLDSDWCLPKRWFSTLGVCLLIGTLEVRCKGDGKAKRIGCALFNHYMIMAKAKKHQQYEPRYWFPLRKFEIENLPSIEGSMTYSWLLRSEANTLELSAICELEKHIWMEALASAIKESKDLYSNSVDSNEYLLEQLFVSSFDQYTQPKQNLDKPIETCDTPVHFPIPGGSSSFSQSAIFNKPSRANNRSSHPIFNTHDFAIKDASQIMFSNGPSSPGLRSQSSISDLREFFSNSVSEKWSQRKFNQYHTRCRSVDTKFDDVCTTPILTARANSMNRNGSTKRVKVSTSATAVATANVHPTSIHSLTKPPEDVSSNASPIFYSPSTTFSESCPSGSSSRRPSVSQNRGPTSSNTDSMIIRLAQRKSSIHRSNSIQSSHTVDNLYNSDGVAATAGMLPPSNSSLSLSNRPAKFFGKMVEKLGQIKTPGKRRNHMMPGSVSSLASISASKPPTLHSNSSSDIGNATPSSMKKKFFPHFLQKQSSKKN